MRRILSRWVAPLALLLFLALAPTVQAAFEVRGDLPTHLASGHVTLLRESLERRSSDAIVTVPVGGKSLAIRVDSGPGLFALEAGDQRVAFVAGEGAILQVKPGADGKLAIAGGTDQELFTRYESFRADSFARGVTVARAAIAALGPDASPAEIARLTDREVAAYAAHRRELNDFTLAHLRGSAALYAASLRWDGDHRLDELMEAVRDYATRFPGAEIGRTMTQRVARFKATALGAVAPALAGPTPDGGTLSLASLRGRYVLVDFWASWCSPCRVENRNYVELYRRFRDAGLEILAVSVDENGPAWKAAIAKDNATWRHLSDLGGWSTPLAADYNVTSLPASFLLDREGRIIARDLRGKNLADRLEALLGSGGKSGR